MKYSEVVGVCEKVHFEGECILKCSLSRSCRAGGGCVVHLVLEIRFRHTRLDWSTSRFMLLFAFKIVSHHCCSTRFSRLRLEGFNVSARLFHICRQQTARGNNLTLKIKLCFCFQFTQDFWPRSRKDCRLYIWIAKTASENAWWNSLAAHNEWMKDQQWRWTRIRAFLKMLKYTRLLVVYWSEQSMTPASPTQMFFFFFSP